MNVPRTRHVFLAVIFLAACFLGTSHSFGQEKCQSFTANGINNWHPFVYRDSNNELTGTIPEVISLALERIGISIEFKSDQPWKRILRELDSGNLDIVLGAYWNSARAQKYFFTEALGIDEVRVFVQVGTEFPLKSYEDLKGKRGLKLLGGSYGDDFDEFAKTHLDFQEIGRSDQIVKMLAGARADFGILGYIEGYKHIEKLGLNGEVAALPWPILSNELHAMINIHASCAHRMQELNKAIRDLKSEGVLDDLLKKHLQQTPTGSS